MSIQKLSLALVTNASGAVTASTPSFSGVLKAIQWVKPASGGITGAGLVVTGVNFGEAVLTVAGLSASASFYPRGPIHTVADVAELYASGGLPVTDTLAFFQDQLQFAVTGGGATLSATAWVIFDGQYP